MIKNRLFDKFIDIEFTIDKPKEAVSSSTSNTLVPTTNSKSTISFKTPKSGIKPNIAFYVNFLPGSNTNDLTVKITNFYSEINIQYYIYIKVTAGYTDGTSLVMQGEIRNCYIEKPNPEGVTVFQCVLGTISDMYELSKDGPFEVVLPASTVSEALNTIADSLGMSKSINIPKEWLNIPFMAIPYTETWVNALDMRTKVNTMLSHKALIFNLPHLYISAVSNQLIVFALTEDSINDTTLILDKVSTAYLAGGNIIVKAPWNPHILQNGLFKMDTKYFRGRMGALQIGGVKKAFGVVSMSIAFSTQGENSMEVNALDLSIAQGAW